MAWFPDTTESLIVTTPSAAMPPPFAVAPAPTAVARFELRWRIESKRFEERCDRHLQNRAWYRRGAKRRPVRAPRGQPQAVRFNIEVGNSLLDERARNEMALESSDHR